MKNFLLTLGIFLPFLLEAQCFSDVNGVREKPVISAFATHGNGKYKKEILWLNWGASTPLATHGAKKALAKGDYTNAEIKINENKFICVETIIDEVSGVTSDVIDKDWSTLDEMYTNSNNTMYHVLRNTSDGLTSNIKLISKAYVRTREALGKPYTDEPIKIKGLIFADAESANSDEYFSLTAKGTWDIIEFINLEGNKKYNYTVEKKSNSEDNTSKITMGYGEDKRVAAIAMLKFNEDAFDTRAEDYKVTYSSKFKGRGLTSIAIGLLTPYADFGDAPISYGSPIHFVENMETTADNLGHTVGERNIGKVTDTSLNPDNFTFKSGSLIKPSNNFVGTLGPDPNPKPVYSEDALGDDYDYDSNNVRTVLTNEEDSWPATYNKFSYKTVNGSNYPIGATIKAEISVKTNVKTILAGWIDFNVNGKFDANERVYKEIPANTNGKVELGWTIPQNRKPFSTYARLRLFEFTNVSEKGILDPSMIQPSSDTFGGEVEDHKIQILPQAVTNPMLLNSTPIYSSTNN